ncbi:DNA primase family protein [Marispirochaeta aestuarii]|nr:phage/plasmid primase, P4 family [Marispirochaeta aestuarii]
MKSINDQNVQTVAIPDPAVGEPIRFSCDEGCHANDGIVSIIKDYVTLQSQSVVCRPHRKLTDLGNSERYADMYRKIAKYNHTSGSWMVYDGTRWIRDTKMYHYNLARQVVRSMYSEAYLIGDTEKRKEMADHAKRSESYSRIKAMLNLAARDPQIACDDSDFDADPDLLNTPSGVFNLRTGVKIEHSPDLMLSKITGIAPDPDHDPKAWLELMEFVSNGKPDLKSALNRFAGSCASGRTPKERVIIAYGEGANSKSVTFETIARCLGDYAAPVAIETLQTNRRAAGHSDDLAALRGVRFTYAAEPSNGIHLDEGRIKALTGGDSIAVSRKGEHTFTYRPCASIAILTNHKPRITGRDTGIWRRVRLFPFQNIVPEGLRDPDYAAKLWEQSGPFILAWIISGAVRWYKDGYGDSETIQTATEVYRQDEDLIGAFIEDCCEIGGSFSTSASKLRTAYEKWCEENGYKPFLGRAWKEALQEQGYPYKKTKYGRYYQGIQLRPEYRVE